jgi:hypothetical protein
VGEEVPIMIERQRRSLRRTVITLLGAVLLTSSLAPGPADAQQTYTHASGTIMWMGFYWQQSLTGKESLGTTDNTWYVTHGIARIRLNRVGPREWDDDGSSSFWAAIWQRYGPIPEKPVLPQCWLVNQQEMWIRQARFTGPTENDFATPYVDMLWDGAGSSPQLVVEMSGGPLGRTGAYVGDCHNDGPPLPQLQQLGDSFVPACPQGLVLTGKLTAAPDVLDFRCQVQEKGDFRNHEVHFERRLRVTGFLVLKP